METNLTGIDNLRCQKDSDATNEKHEENRRTLPVKVLRNLSTFILVFGILTGFILLFTTFHDGASGQYPYSSDTSFNPMSFIYFLASIIPAVFLWAIGNVFAEISENTKRIAEKLK